VDVEVLMRWACMQADWRDQVCAFNQEINLPSHVADKDLVLEEFAPDSSALSDLD
jgi:hypothetical protein